MTYFHIVKPPRLNKLWPILWWEWWYMMIAIYGKTRETILSPALSAYETTWLSSPSQRPRPVRAPHHTSDGEHEGPSRLSGWTLNHVIPYVPTKPKWSGHWVFCQVQTLSDPETICLSILSQRIRRDGINRGIPCRGTLRRQAQWCSPGHGQETSTDWRA